MERILYIVLTDKETLRVYRHIIIQTYGRGENAKINYECETLTDEEFKTQEFVDKLNILIEADANGKITTTDQNVWKMDTEGINGGYPIFSWQ